ncbi:MAG: GGDEF domain-containing protein [Nitrincola lacisaponensis]|uniref:GGDEF domain-containing protein n=1 Tax=Nitrincola lacisaponensis TaxID=267850 RepID=UPI003919F9CB
MVLTLFIVLTVLLTVLSIVLTLRLNRLNQRYTEFRDWAESEIERVNRCDSETGALKLSAFAEQLDNECRRAVREFTPLTLMCLDIRMADGSGLPAEAMREIVAILKHQLSRPGDQLGRYAEQQLGLLLPSTNEHAGSFAERCHQALQQHFESIPVQLTLAACTFQPSASLNGVMAQQLVDETLVQALHEAPGQVLFHAEYSHDFNPTYA